MFGTTERAFRNECFLHNLKGNFRGYLLSTKIELFNIFLNFSLFFVTYYILCIQTSPFVYSCESSSEEGIIGNSKEEFSRAEGGRERVRETTSNPHPLFSLILPSESDISVVNENSYTYGPIRMGIQEDTSCRPILQINYHYFS